MPEDNNTILRYYAREASDQIMPYYHRQASHSISLQQNIYYSCPTMIAQIFQTEHVQANTHADNINQRKPIFYSFPFCKITNNSMDL